MDFKLTVVCCDAVWVQGGKLLVEFTDGALREYTHWPKLADPRLWVLNRTHEQVVEFCRSANFQHRVDCNVALHLHKERVYGHGYAARGY